MSYPYLHNQTYVIQLKSGLSTNIAASGTTAVASNYEPHYTTDTNQLYVFNGTENVLVGGALPYSNIGTTAGLVAISPTGFLLSGSATVYDDLVVSPFSASRGPGGAKDPTITKLIGGTNGLYAEFFSATTEQELFFSVQLPHSYKQGSDVYPHVHFWVPTAGAGSVVWGLEYSWANIGDQFSNPVTLTASTSATTLSANLIGHIGTLTGTGKTISSIIQCRIYRDATNSADNYGSSVGLLSIDFHYEKDTIGSNEVLTK